MPVIISYLQALLKKKPCMIGSPDEVVAMGAGIYAGIKERKQDIKDLVLTDICPFTLGVNVVNYSEKDNPIMSAVIERNSILPCSKTGFYTNSYDKQSHITIGIYQGEAYYCNDNLKLGAIEMDILPVPAGQAHLEVCFSYDINGILEVEVTDHQMRQMKRKVLTCNSLRMSEDELNRRLEELQSYKLMPVGGMRTKLVLARGERLFAQFFGGRRRQVADVMEQLLKAISSRNDQQISNSIRAAEEIFDRLEEL